MNSSPRAVSVNFENDRMLVELTDGRVIGVPLAWFPRLLQATKEQRMHYDISSRGIHWEEIDEDISVAGLLEGRGDMTHRPQSAA